jgi:hypothetical protein
MTSHVVVIGPKLKSWAIGLEIACTLAKNGNQVLILDFSNFQKHWPYSFGRKFKQFRLTSLYKIEVQKIRRNRAPFDLEILEGISSTDELSRLKFDDIQIGHLILASLYAKLGTASLEIAKVEKSLIRATASLVVDVLFSISRLELFEHSAVEELIVFNGREPIEASCLLLASNTGISTRVSERASTSDKYCIYRKSPHTNSEWWDKIQKFEESTKFGGVVVSEELREIYKKEKSSGFDPYQKIKWREYMDPSERFDLPSTDYVVFYSVSTGEVSPFPDFETKLGFQDQFSALRALIEEAKKLNLVVVIRRHPNSLGQDGLDRELTMWEEFQNLSNVKYFGPTQKVDSYLLARGARCCFTWRSTIGFDTLCLGIPSYSLGPSKWALDDSVRAWDSESLVQALGSPVLPAPELVNLYAAYMSHFGEKLTYFREIERWGYTSNSGYRVSNFLFQRTLSALFNWTPKN